MRLAKGKYVLQQVIASGTFGRVYSSPPFAIKEVRLASADLSSSRKLVRALTTEARILTALNHPNVVRLYEVFAQDENMYLVMECCEQTLQAALAAPDCAQVLPIMEQVLAGCRAMADKGVVHRDLKPANILVKDGVVKIADFGMSLCLEAHEDRMLETHAGTPYYMAPQILKRARYTRKCDVWSVGVIFFQLLFHRLPWDAKNEASLLAQILTRPLAFPPATPVQAQQLVQRMLTYSEAKRASWEEVAALLALLKLKVEAVGTAWLGRLIPRPCRSRSEREERRSLSQVKAGSLEARGAQRETFTFHRESLDRLLAHERDNLSQQAYQCHYDVLPLSEQHEIDRKFRATLMPDRVQTFYPAG